ncbi:hypothetical protein G9A89_000854 [Geosiphon pyriformis]|nr:hypothetical protein G9A89_000854 [Geosiphon pyriformis]
MPTKITQYLQRTPEKRSYHFFLDNKIQLPLEAASSSILIPQILRIPNYTDKLKQPEFENCEEESESESEETSEKTSTRPEEPNIREATFRREEEETDVHTWLREAQKAIQANNWNNQKAIQTLPFFLKGTADSWYQSLETKPMSFAKFKDAFLEYFSDSNVVIQLQNKFNTIKQSTDETVTQYLA